MPKPLKWTFDNFNPDTMDAEDLREFYTWANGLMPFSKAKRFFGGTTPQNYLGVFKSCYQYADNRATAMECRSRGDIPAAQIYETICQNIYNSLPHWARW